MHAWLKATYAKKGRCHKNGVDYFAKEKFVMDFEFLA